MMTSRGIAELANGELVLARQEKGLMVAVKHNSNAKMTG
jgi:hypothetical protein